MLRPRANGDLPADRVPHDLTEGIVVGFAIGAVLFIDRMAGAITIEGPAPLVPEDRADDADGERRPYDPALAADPDIIAYRIAGLLLGAATSVGAVLDRITDGYKASSSTSRPCPSSIPPPPTRSRASARRPRGTGCRPWSLVSPPRIRYTLLTHGLRAPHVRYKRAVEEAVRAARAAIAGAAGPAQPPTASTP